MTDISKAIAYLKNKGIESFELNNILVIPCDKPEQIYPLAEKSKRIFKEIDYQKSWRIDPYYWQKRRREDGSIILSPDEFV